MKTSETLRKLAEALADTNGNHIIRCMLIELSDEVVKLEERAQ